MYNKLTSCVSADVSASAADWPVGEGKKAPVGASDSSSSGGSDSEEDDKKMAGAPPTVAVAAEIAAVIKIADPKRLVSCQMII